VYVAIVVFGVMCGLAVALAGGGEAGVRSAIRATARSTLLVFLVVFCTSSLRRRWPAPATHWLMRNRRYLGLSAAVSHAYHLAFIVTLNATVASEETELPILIGGSFGFVMLALMAATSNDASQRRLRRNWRRLHLVGMWTIWIIYAFSYFPRALDGPIGAGASALLLAALALRWWPAGSRAAST